MLSESPWRVNFVIGMAVCIVSAQAVLLFNPTSRGWPFSPILIYQREGAPIYRSLELRVWDEKGEKGLIEAGLSHNQLQVSLILRARRDSREDRERISRYLRAVAEQRGASFEGLRVYRVRWKISEARKLDEELVFEDRW